MRTCLLVFLVGSFATPAFTQGTSCSDAIPIVLNGTSVSYSSSSSTGSNVLCANNGTTPITWFSVTTNSAAESPLLNIATGDGLACEIAMYSGCGGNMNNNYEDPSSLCFYDGNGLWAPAETFVIAPNHTYYLRIKTSTATTIAISGQHYNPPNNQCTGAFNISPVGITDNNAAHHLGPGVSAVQLCASSLENTAFYQYNVATTGNTIINISNISCDNGFNNVLNGFQIGFFTGTCSNLHWESCSSGSGTFVQATTGVLTADTKVIVAVDGNAGSNCRYDIQAINAYLLATEIINFSVWKAANLNVLKWTSLASSAKHFELERSENGKVFVPIGSIEAKQAGTSPSNYSFEDNYVYGKLFYRLKVVGDDGKTYYTKTVLITREISKSFKLNAYTSSKSLHITFDSDADTKCEYAIINLLGQRLQQGTLFFRKGTNHFEKNISGIPPGKYFILFDNKGEKINSGFIKEPGIL